MDKEGDYYFRSNKIVKFLLDAGPFDMNKLGAMPFSKRDMEQFVQLIGYSVAGFGELTYVSEKAYNKAMKKMDKLDKKLREKN